MIETNCPNCSTQYKLDSKFEGRLVRCRTCRHEFRVELEEFSAGGSGTEDAAEQSASGSSPVSIQCCDSCGTEYKVKPEMAGRSVRCRVCSHDFQIAGKSTPSRPSSVGGRTRVSQAEPDFQPGSGPSRKNPRSSVDNLGFLTDFDHEDDSAEPVFSHQEDDDERIMREAARRGANRLDSSSGQTYGLPAARRKSSSNKGIPPAVWISGAGLVGLFAVVVLLINVISNAGLRSSLSGVPVEIAAEFQQENDPALGSPAPESARIDKNMQVRDLSRHKALVRSMAKDFNEMADALARIQDLESAKANQQKLVQLGDHVKEVAKTSQNQKLFNPNPKESRLLAREVGGDLRKAAGRIRTEMLRLQGIREFSMGTMFAMPQIERGIQEIEREFVDKGDIPDADKYAEVRVAGLKTNNEREYIAEKLGELATPRASRKATAPSAATRYALWPVDSPEIFSKKIDFGKVIRTTGKEVWVVADPIDAAVIRERLAKKESEEQKRKDDLTAAQQAFQKALEAARSGNAASNSAASGDAEIPANADDVTKGLLLVKSSNHFKRQDGLRVLLGADFKGRDQEVFDAVSPLLSGQDPFIVKDSVAVILRTKAAGVIDFLAGKLNDDRVRDDVIKAVTPLKEPKLAGPLASIMKNDTWKNADKALVAIGSPAEEAVIGQLASPDQGVRQRACEILAEIGGETTLKAMKRLPADKVPWVRDAANNAVRSIQNRLKITRKAETNSL